MTRDFKCPSCGGPLDYDGSNLTVRCPFCGNSVIVPEELRGAPSTSPPPSVPATRTVGDLKEFGEIVRLAEGGDRIAAIKLYRQVTDVGLKEAKDAVDKIAAGEAAEVAGYPVHRGQLLPPPSAPDRAEQIARIGRLLGRGNKIEAIKAYRETFGVGLKEAKDAVERLETTVDTPGAFDLHPPGAAPPASTAAPRATATAGSARSPRRGCAIGLIIVAAAVALWIAYSANHGDNRLAASIRRLAAVKTPTPTATLPPGPTRAPTPAPTATPTPGFYYSPSILVGCSGGGRGCFEHATSIGVDGAGNIYVGEYTGGRVQVFDPTGEFIAQWRIGGEDADLRRLAVDRQGIVYAVADGAIYRYAGGSGELLGQMDYSGGAGFQDVAAAPDGKLAASWNRDWQGGVFVDFDASQDDIVVFDRAGQVAAVFPKALSEIGGGDPELDTEIAVDGEGNIYATGLLNPAIFKFTAGGKFVSRIGEGQVDDVAALAVDAQGRVYAASHGDILVFAPDGRYLALIDWSPDGMVVNGRNELLMIDDTQVIKLALDR